MTALDTKALLEGVLGEPWKFVPWHVAEGPSQVVSGEGWLVCETSCDSHAALIASAPRLARRVIELEEVFDWLAANTGLELSHCEVGGDLSECAWCVHRVQGGVNDREWELIAAGETPLEALTNARAALKGEGE